MFLQNQKDNNQSNSTEYTPKEISQDQDDRNNFISKVLRAHFDPDSYSKFQQVLDYIGQKLYQPLYTEFNSNLSKSVENDQINDYFEMNHYIKLKAKFYAFCFIKQIGSLLTVQLANGSNCIAEKNYLILTKILLHHGLTSKSDTANLALVELEQLCLNRGLTLQSLYYTYRVKFLRVIIKAILLQLKCTTTEDVQTVGSTPSTSSNGRSNIVITYMTRAFEVFNIVTISINDVAQSLIIITNLLHKELFDDVIKQFLEHLAAYQNIDICTLLRSHIQTIIVSLLLKRKLSQFDMHSNIEKLCSFCDKKPTDILFNKITSIKGHLMLYYSLDPKIVTDGIFFLSRFEEDQPMEEELDDEKTFIEYLSPALIGILFGIDEHFVATKHEFGSEESVMKVESLVKFLTLLSVKNIADIRVKLLSTLASLVNMRPSLQNIRLDKAILDAWTQFVCKLSNDMKPELAVNICVNLQDLVEDFPGEVGLIYENLLLGYQSEALPKALRSLFFIPNYPEFEKVYKLITPEANRKNIVGSLSHLEANIEYTKPLLSAENQRSKQLGLIKLRDLLSVNQTLIMSSILTHLEEPVTPVISRIIETLLGLSCNIDRKGWHILAECFGILGAINPVRMNTQIYGGQKKTLKCIVSLFHADFIVELVELLTSCLHSDKTSESESASYALQVVIQKFPIHKDPKMRSRLSAEGLRAYELCQKTRYGGFRRFQPDLSTTIYEKLIGQNNFSYKDWIDKFSLNLFSTIKEKPIRDMLDACSYVFRYNLQLAEYLLPYAIIHIIINQPAHVGIIKREILMIVEKDIGLSDQALDKLRDTDHEEDNIRTLLVQCANIVFRTLDLIYGIEWLNCKPGLKPTLDTYQLDSLREFAKSIPKDKLAMTAVKCRAHIRALYYLDQHLCIKKSDFNQYATLLQKIYVALDDTFGAAGIEMVRTTPMTIIDDISNYESMGRFDKAFACYTTVLNSMKNCKDKELLILDSLRCLSNQGDFQRLYDRTRRVMDENIELKRDIMPYAIEASWKLSKWDHLDSYLNIENVDRTSGNTAVGFGQLLSCLKISRSKVASTLQSVRQDFMKPLSLAMVDQSACFRGYENLLALHSLGDFAMCIKILDDSNIDSQPVDGDKLNFTRIRLDKLLGELFNIWNERNKLVQPSLISIDQILEWQRSMCSLMASKYDFLKDKINIHVGKLWLTSSKVAREAGIYHRSFECLTQARHSFGSEFDLLSLDLRIKYHIEQAELYWDQGDQTKAIRGLKHTLNEFKDHVLYKHLEDKSRLKSKDIMIELSDLVDCSICSNFSPSDRDSFSKLNMLLTQYSEESASAIPDHLFLMYEKSVHLGVDREETYFRLARYYDKLVTYYTDNPSLFRQQTEANQQTQLFSQNLGGVTEDIHLKLMEHSIFAFGNSLKYGARHLRESMPRMLNIWYDLASRKAESADRRLSGGSDNHRTSALRSTVFSTTRFIGNLKDNIIPPYYFMTAISILLSSICHPHKDVCNMTTDILEQLLNYYPHQISWLMMACERDSANRLRTLAAKKILDPNPTKRGSLPKSPRVVKIVRDTRDFCELLCKLTIKKLPSGYESKNGLLKNDIKIAELYPDIRKLRYADLSVLVPCQATMCPVIPMDVAIGHNPGEHNIYPDCNMCYMRGFGENVRLFNSLQKPRLVKLICYNGQEVKIICKYGDDMRKDSRCIEFLNFLNILLRRDSQSNLKFMDIQTFLVLPLENNIGIIEMLSDCQTLRSCMEGLYKERKKNFSFATKPLNLDRSARNAAEVYLDHFEKVLLPTTTPPVLSTWFLRTFTDPTSWYLARLAYTRTAAVTSMGGYIIGLGDRHLDNILIDTRNGKLVHVDFNLLFHQGESLGVPERVPFRLTHNIIAAFGPMGTEGNFRKVCEIAMRVMRKNKDAMLTTLKPFIHDPCIDWIKSKNRLDDSGVLSATSKIEVTERKLKGFPRSMHFKPLTMIDSYSVEAQVDNLITEASDNQNLALMFPGWCPHA